MTVKIEGIAGLKALVGTDLGKSHPLRITQERVDQFAEATGDHQWIHVDPERAAAGPFGTTIAHGYLTLALGPALAPKIYEVSGFKMAINYGSNKVRYPSPLKVGSAVVLSIHLDAVMEIAGGVQVTMTFTFTEEGSTKPCCVAENIYRYLE